MIVPKTAIPTVDPTFRKNWVDAVATPRSARAASFWTTSVYCCIAMPSPSPRTTIATVSWVWVAVWSIRVRRYMPAAMIATPPSMKGR